MDREQSLSEHHQFASSASRFYRGMAQYPIWKISAAPGRTLVPLLRSAVTGTATRPRDRPGFFAFPLRGQASRSGFRSLSAGTCVSSTTPFSLSGAVASRKRWRCRDRDSEALGHLLQRLPSGHGLVERQPPLPVAQTRQGSKGVECPSLLATP